MRNCVLCGKMKKKALIQDQGNKNTKSSLISTTAGV